MFEVKSEPAKNRLFIKLSGFMTPEEAKQAADQVIKVVSHLKTGYAAINDITEFKPGREEVQNEIVRAQKFLTENGAKVVIRVVKSVSGEMQFKRLTDKAKIGYEIIEVNSVEDALKYLDSK